jgi:hypothetical protein
MRERSALPLAIGVVVLVVLGVWLIGGAPIRGPLDPRSHEPAGTSALVALLDDLGADTSIRVERLDRDTDTALLLWDRLDEAETDRLADWVDAGGTLVVTDPGSSFAPPGTGFSGLVEADAESIRDAEPVSIDAGSCDVPPFLDQDLESVAVMGGPIRYEVGPGDQSCFGDGDEAFVVVTEVGEGNVVAFGGSGTVINRTLDEEDNAAAIAGVLAPREGTKVGVLDLGPGRSAAGDEALLDVLPTWTKRVLVQLGIAFLVYVLWRLRRLGKPVPEPQPVKVAASELVAATGGLLERSRSPQYAADVLRNDLRRDLTVRLGLPRNLSPDTFAEVVAARTQLDAAQLQAALGPGPVSDDADLLTVARLIDTVRKEVFVHVGS